MITKFVLFFILSINSTLSFANLTFEPEEIVESYDLTQDCELEEVTESYDIKNKKELATVADLDVKKYLGRWYQIARNPLPFEPTNCACAQQTLDLVNSEVTVYNSCNVGGPAGSLIEIRGKAFSQDPINNSKFTVDFGLPQLGQYWIIGVATDYSWAVVTDPSERSLYVLSKTPELDLQSYTEALKSASAQTSLGQLLVTDHKSCSYPN
jgi:apolipoprotein D and lipocalin family protein